MLLTGTLSVCAAGYGAAAGVLLPRAVHRLAVGPGLPPRTHCPAGHALPPSWRGWAGAARCPRCPPASAAYGPGGRFYVVAGALLCAGLAAAVGPRPELAVWLLLAPFGLLLASVDRRVRRLPDVLTLPMAVATAALLGVASLLPGAGGSWVRALLGGAALAGAYFLLFVVHPRGLGFGDVKLALTLGVALGWYGWPPLLAGAFLGFLLLACYGGALMLSGRAGRRTLVPFGPFMVLGAALGLLLGGAGA